MTAALEGGEWSAARPGRTLSPGKTRYSFYRRLGGPQGRSGRAENLVPTEIRSRTVQLVVAIPTELPGSFVVITLTLKYWEKICILDLELKCQNDNNDHNVSLHLSFVFGATAPPPPSPVDKGLLIHEVFKSHTTTHHSR